MSESSLFASLRAGSRIWAIGAIHSQTQQLIRLHQAMIPEIRPGDQLVYLGNYSGLHPDACACINEVLLFRRAFMAIPGHDACDVVLLRGAQEEMLSQLLKLHFAPNPGSVMEWMLNQGLDATLDSYGMNAREGLAAARHGPQPLARWVNLLRGRIRACDGHQALMSALHHGAGTGADGMLFVHAGFDPARPPDRQSDGLWWGTPGFTGITAPVAGIAQTIIRGYDRRRGGFARQNATVTLDGGCGRGGVLLAACFAPDGTILHLLEA